MRISKHSGVMVAAGALSVLAPAFADEPFQWEIGGDYAANTIELGGQFGREQDTDTLSLDATWFFAPVTPTSGPLERAGFLERASSLRFGGAAGEVDPGDADIRGYSAVLRYILPGSDWFVTALAARRDIDFSANSESDQTNYGAGIGRYLGERTAVTFDLQRQVLESSISSQPGLTFEDRFGINLYTVGVEHLGDLGTEWQYGIDASLLVPDEGLDDGILSGRVTLYPNRNLGFGFDYTAAVEDTFDRPQQMGVFVRWFVDEAWSVSASYDWVEWDVPGEDNEDRTISIGARYRF